MICEKCGKEFQEDWRKDKKTRETPCRFCSRGCANSKKQTKEMNEARSFSNKKWMNENKEKFKEIMKKVDKTNFLLAKEKWIEERKKNLETGDFDTFGYDNKKKRILIEQNGKCNKCGLSVWFDKPISLEIDHKDGNNKNNNRDNLEALCPNCHSLTDTWRGRNKVIKKNISNQKIIEAFLETGNIRQCLIKIGLTPKGGNYQRIKNVLLENEIDY
jgi:hypothetical protein